MQMSSILTFIFNVILKQQQLIYKTAVLLEILPQQEADSYSFYCLPLGVFIILLWNQYFARNYLFAIVKFNQVDATVKVDV